MSILILKGSTAGSGGGSNALSAAVAAASADAWGTITIGNQMDVDYASAGASGMEYSPKLTWDPINKGLQYFFGNHGGGSNVQRLWLGLYGATANTWSPNSPPVSVPNSVQTDPTHGFAAGATDTTTGYFYCDRPYYAGKDFNRYRVGTGWDTPLATVSGSGAVACGCLEYHPNLYGGQGGLVYGSMEYIATLNLQNIAGGWTVIRDRHNEQDIMVYGGFGVSCYSTKDDAVYMGSGSSGLGLWKIPAAAGAGTPTQISACPVTTGVWDNGNNVATIVGSGNSANNMVAIQRDGDIYSYASSGNTWSGPIGTLPAALISASYLKAFGSIPEYGCIVGVTGNSTQTGTALHYWKH